MSKWQYMNASFLPGYEATFHPLGREGWELVSVVFQDGRFHMFFKKPDLHQYFEKHSSEPRLPKAAELPL